MKRSMLWLSCSFAALTSQFVSASAFAEDAKITQAKLDYLVKPFYKNVGKLGNLVASDGTRLGYGVFKQPVFDRGTIVLLPGYTEPFAKFDETIFDLFVQGYSVFALDHRGQGSSQGRVMDQALCKAIGVTWGDAWEVFDVASFTFLPKAQGSVCLSDVVHIDNYASYVADVKQFVEEVVKVKSHHHSKRFVVGHSMGSTVAAQYMMEFPNDFAAAALESPMIGIQAPGLSEQQIYGLSAALVGAGAGVLPPPPPLSSAYNPASDSMAGKDLEDGIIDGANLVTHSAVRFDHAAAQRKADYNIAMARPSFSWVKASLEASWAVMGNAQLLSTPTLILQGGQDFLTPVANQDIVCAGAEHCKIFRIEGARHEIFQEKDEFRKPAIREVLRFLNENR